MTSTAGIILEWGGFGARYPLTQRSVPVTNTIALSICTIAP